MGQLTLIPQRWLCAIQEESSQIDSRVSGEFSHTDPDTKHAHTHTLLAYQSDGAVDYGIHIWMMLINFHLAKIS